MAEQENLRAQLTGIGADLVEPAFDTLIASEILKEIPVLGIGARIASAAGTIRDRIFAAKLLRFLEALGDVDGADVREMRYRLKKDPELRDRVGSTVMVIIERLDEVEKARMIAKAFRAYLSNRIDLPQFRRIGLAVNTAFLDDLQAFASLPTTKNLGESSLAQFLISAGLTEQAQTGFQMGDFTSLSITVSSLGELFWHLMRDS